MYSYVKKYDEFVYSIKVKYPSKGFFMLLFLYKQ